MSIVTFTGPIKAGDVLNTTGTTAGTIKNVGFVVMVQVAPITQAGTATAAATSIVLPAYSHILQIQMLTSVGFDGVSSNLSLGTTAAVPTDLVAATSIANVGVTGMNPGTSAPLTAKWSNVGASDVVIFAKSTNTGAGVGELVVRYIQAENA
jgi:hypothetical protein